VPGRNATDVHDFIANVTLDETGKGVFNWQMSPCNLKMAKAI
jgi:phosphohistidine phosphatase